MNNFLASTKAIYSCNKNGWGCCTCFCFHQNLFLEFSILRTKEGLSHVQQPRPSNLFVRHLLSVLLSTAYGNRGVIDQPVQLCTGMKVNPRTATRFLSLLLSCVALGSDTQGTYKEQNLLFVRHARG